MKCIHCMGSMTQGRAPFSADREGMHVHWDALPAWVCDQCGEAYFAAATVDRIQDALAAFDHVSEIDAA